LRTKEVEEPRVVVGSNPCPMREERWRKPNEKQNLTVYTRRQLQHEQPMGEERWRKPNEEENVRVYTRRELQHEQLEPQPTTGTK
jgi:hypothetical protein